MKKTAEDTISNIQNRVLPQHKHSTDVSSENQLTGFLPLTQVSVHQENSLLATLNPIVLEFEVTQTQTLLLQGYSKIETLKNELENLPETCRSSGEQTAFQKLDSSINQLSIIRNQLSSEEETQLKLYFNQLILPITNQSLFCSYAYSKPRGYAGDFWAMELIWRGRTQPDNNRYQGESPIGKLINAYTLDMHNCKANEYRIHKLKSIILSKAYTRIASVGCGSGIEIYESSQEKDLRACEFHLFDQDSGALELLSNKIDGTLQNINFHQGNILKTILKLNDLNFDLIYSSGLFDYFSNESALRLANKLWANLASGGCLCITNAHTANPTKLWMEYATDWYLQDKNTQDMVSLIGKNQNINKIILEKDPFSVYQYLCIYKE